MPTKRTKRATPPPYPTTRVADWLYGTDPQRLNEAERMDVLNACGFFLARSKLKENAK